MIRLLLAWVVNAVALLALPYVFSGIHVASFTHAMVAALVLGLINTLIRPVLILLTLPATVLTLGLIGCWQVFDQIYTGTQGGPGKTTLTPAYLSYSAAFLDQDWGQGAAIAFILFAIIVILTIFQRWVLRDRPVSKRRARQYELPQKKKEVAR